MRNSLYTDVYSMGSYPNNSIKRAPLWLNFAGIVIIVGIIVCLATFLPTKLQLGKFEGHWRNGEETWFFEDTEDVFQRVTVITEDTKQIGKYSIKEGHFQIEWQNSEGYYPTQNKDIESYNYYFSEDGKTLELHWLDLDGFMTLKKID